MNKTVWIYWQNLKGSTPPPYIELSRWTMLENLEECSLNIVTPENVEMYLPGIGQLINDIEIDITGRADRFLRRFQGGNRKNLAVKTDVIRAFLLRNYGGLYIDADAIVFKDLSKYFDLIDKHEFLGIRRTSKGKDHLSVNFYGSKKNGKLITKYTDRMLTLLSQKREFAYNDLGGQLLTSVFDQEPGSSHILEEAEIQPITFENAREVFASKSIKPEDILDTEQHIMMLFNGPFHNELKNFTLTKLYQSDTFVSRCFRRALSEESFFRFIKNQSYLNT